MYVDDAHFGADSLSEATLVRDDFFTFLAKANFQLHKWATNKPQLLTGIPPTNHYFDNQELCVKTELKTLGMSFDTILDSVKKKKTCKIVCPTTTVKSWDKRSILSFIRSFFVPLGLAGSIL